MEAPPAGGHNAPPRKAVIDENGEMLFGPRDEPDLAKIAAIGLPFWLAGAAGTPEALVEAPGCRRQGRAGGHRLRAVQRTPASTTTSARDLIAGIVDGSLHVKTDPLASPTGFPFKVAQLSGTLSEPPRSTPPVRACATSASCARPTCKDGDTGRLPLRLRAEHMYVKKGGEPEDTVGRQCICNGLHRRGGHRPDAQGRLRRTADRHAGLRRRGTRASWLGFYPDGWNATQVVDWLLSG